MKDLEVWKYVGGCGRVKVGGGGTGMLKESQERDGGGGTGMLKESQERDGWRGGKGVQGS